MSKDNRNICESKKFEALYNAYAKDIRRFLFYKTQDLDKAEDILQEVFIKLWENCNKVDYDKVKSYIYSIANNMFLNEVKHQKVVQNYGKHSKRESTNESPSSYSSLTGGADFTFSSDNTDLVSSGTGENIGLELTLEKSFSKGYHALITSSIFESTYEGSDGIQ